MEWAFLWLMVALKVPIALLFAIVWWAVRKTDEPEPGQDDEGGTKVDPHNRGPLSRPPRRRGPHGGRAAPAPPRNRRGRIQARPRALP